MDIGKRIKELREAQGLRQKELANMSKISNTYLSDVETGRSSPSLKTLEKIAMALKMSCHKLLDIPDTNKDK